MHGCGPNFKRRVCDCVFRHQNNEIRQSPEYNFLNHKCSFPRENDLKDANIQLKSDPSSRILKVFLTGLKPIIKYATF